MLDGPARDQPVRIDATLYVPSVTPAPAVLVAHGLQTCSHVVVMHRGRLVAAGTVADLVSGGGATFTVGDPAAAAAVLRTLDGVADVTIDVAAAGEVHAVLNGTPRSVAVAALVGAGVPVTAAGPRRGLEDAFLRLVGES